MHDQGTRPHGATNVDGRLHEEKGLLFAGLGGATRHPNSPNTYTEEEMRRRVRRLVRRVRRRRRVDVVITHSPPSLLGREPNDARKSFESFHLLIEKLRPGLLLHGHVDPQGAHRRDRVVNGTRIVNVSAYAVLET
jgi:Icc-related predicted phosphoesterase